MIDKCLFPVAGYGTRFLPATKAMPKEMLPILNKPLVQYGVEEAMAAGLTNISFVTGRGKRAIEDHFDFSYELEHQVKATDKEALLSGITTCAAPARSPTPAKAKCVALGRRFSAAGHCWAMRPSA